MNGICNPNEVHRFFCLKKKALQRRRILALLSPIPSFRSIDFFEVPPAGHAVVHVRIAKFIFHAKEWIYAGPALVVQIPDTTFFSLNGGFHFIKGSSKVKSFWERNGT